MISNNNRPGTRRGFYGWIALSGAVLVLFSANVFIQSFGVFLPVIADEFSWNRATVAAAITLGMLAMGLPSPLWGVLTAKFGPRILIILGNALAAASLAGLYFLHDLWYLYFFYIIGGLGAGLGGYIPITTIANNWFTKRVSLAMALITTAGGAAGFIFPPLTTTLIEAAGWRLTWVILGAIVLTGSSVIGGMVLVRNKPEDMGQLPDGNKSDFTEAYAKIQTHAVDNNSQTGGQIKKLLKLPVTWLISFFAIATGIVLGTMTAHQVAFIQDIGYSPMTAATTMSVLAVSSIVSGLAFGTLALKINIKFLGAAAFILELAGMIILLTTQNLTLIYIFSALVGTGSGALIAAMPIFVGTYYGRQIYSRLMGFVIAFHIAAFAVSGVIAGAIYDATGKYTLDFIMVAGFIVVGLVSISLARKPKLKD